ncbi:MAG: tetratricopeptide repeat protein [Methanoregula sp.]|uniref:tetratricopeptide repeat protein n=1 Tax=Methanoregula sp. TaxID=2052170 RepID=UPI003D0C6FEC
MQMSAKAGILLVIILILVPAVAAEDSLEWYTRGQNAANAGNYADAVTYYNNALSLDPSYAFALAGKAMALNALGQYSEALDAANQALAIRTSTDAQNAMAYALFKLGRYDEAVAAYVNFTATVTNHADAYCNLAFSYVQTGNPDAALKAYAQCANLDPHNAGTWNQIGLVYMSQDKYTEALDAFNHATQETTKSAEIWNNKGLALAALGRYQDALDCFNAALTISPVYADAEKNKESVMGKSQVYQVTGSPTPTKAPWVLGGGTSPATVPTTAAAQTAVNVTESLPAGTIAVTATETPVATKTTYTPLSPIGALTAIVVAGIVFAGAKRRKN